MSAAGGKWSGRRIARGAAAGWALAAALVTTGCGGRPGVEITGSVTRATGGAVTGGEVMIEPAGDAAEGPRQCRQPIREGRYRFGREAGVQPGAYTLRVIPATVLPGEGDQSGSSLFTPVGRAVTVSADPADNVFDVTVEPLQTFLP